MNTFKCCCFFRNAVLENSLSELGLKAPNPRKTGTTIAGLVYQGGVILGADTRATDDMVVADKNCMKIHHIAPSIYCCGAGVAADAEVTTQIMASNVELHSLNTGRPPLVAMVTRQLKQMLFRSVCGASLIVGGVDVAGAHLYSVYPQAHMINCRSSPRVRLTSLRSRRRRAVFEDRYKPDMELEEAKRLVRDAICAGIFCDLGSGSNVDLCVITEALLRSINNPIAYFLLSTYRYERGTTKVLTENVTRLNLDLIQESVVRMDQD
uniref:Proteasome subunit beta n=1 Tax=Neogobius melanostomus TaxID=47308 RepID=A0A8C6V2Z7_9GOBI